MFIDLHGYGHWGCQLALVAGLRKLYEDSRQPDYRWPNSDLVVSHLLYSLPYAARFSLLVVVMLCMM